ncbi:hypothetical protein ACTQZS_02495 [Bilifractor sp. LCP19S3_H10]|uniref:hypothetical protein n=1 Tax=Bilifractor sp. LCP19S3_H10 TaxID=3438736 RepID=UPI003F8DCFC2
MRNWKKIETLGLAGLMVLGILSSAVPAMADTVTMHTVQASDGTAIHYSENNFDPSKTGSLTIYKYEDNEGVMDEGDGQYHSLEDLNTAFGLSEGQKLRPMSGVQFTATKIADISEIAGTTDTRIAYTGVDAAFTALLKSYGINLNVSRLSLPSGENVSSCTFKDMENALKAMNASTGTTDKEVPGETALIRYGKDHPTKQFPLTDGKGKTSLTDLPLGLYLITETDYRPSAKAVLESQQGAEDVQGDTTQNHQDVENFSSPYLVSVPMTNISTLDGKEAGTVWQYDITSYPKNQTTSITKKIVSSDPEDKLLLEDYEDYDIGDTVRQVIYADAPANLTLDYHDLGYNSQAELDAAVKAGTEDERSLYQARPYTTFAISDSMTEGLKFGSVERVFLTPYVGSPSTEMGFEQYTSTEQGKKQELQVNQDYVVIKKPITGNAVSDSGSFTVPADNKASSTEFTVQLTDKGIAKLNALTDKMRSQVVVYFTSMVTPKARIGTDFKNTNQATLTWKHSNTSTHTKKSNETRIFTYELDLTKTPGSGTSGNANKSSFDPSQAAFTVRQMVTSGHGYAGEKGYLQKGHTADTAGQVQGLLANANNLGHLDGKTGGDTDYVRFVKESDGVYHVYSKTSDSSNTPVTTIHPAKSGKLQIKGLDSETYRFQETDTDTRFSLFSQTFDITLSPLSQTDQEGTQKGGGNGLTQEQIQSSSTATNYLAANGLAVNHVNGQLAQATVTTGNTRNVTMKLGGTYNNEQSYTGASAKGKNNGVASLTVKNDKTITLLTGGTGRYIVYASAAIGCLILAVYTAKTKRKKS